MDTEKPWYKSKKLWAAVTGCIIVLGNTLLGIPEESLQLIVGVVGTYIIGQGAADFGKNS